MIVSYLEDIGKVSEVEDVMEFDRSWEEHLCHPGVQGNSTINKLQCLFLNCCVKTIDFEMLCEDATVNCFHCLFARETQGENAEMPLKECNTKKT